jgi:Na+-transporting methylmalonyl-CoA/oxaloacetate decarboxylase gamma subunit
VLEISQLFTSELLLNIGGMGLAALSLFVIFFFVKKFSKAISEFLRVLSNHLTHLTETTERDIKSRDEYAAKFSALITKIEDYFRK